MYPFIASSVRFNCLFTNQFTNRAYGQSILIKKIIWDRHIQDEHVQAKWYLQMLVNWVILIH